MVLRHFLSTLIALVGLAVSEVGIAHAAPRTDLNIGVRLEPRTSIRQQVPPPQLAKSAMPIFLKA